MQRFRNIHPITTCRIWVKRLFESFWFRIFSPIFSLSSTRGWGSPETVRKGFECLLRMLVKKNQVIEFLGNIVIDSITAHIRKPSTLTTLPCPMPQDVESASHANASERGGGGRSGKQGCDGCYRSGCICCNVWCSFILAFWRWHIHASYTTPLWPKCSVPSHA